MGISDGLVRWNQWYDRAPESWRFLIILVPLLVLGAINLLLTVSGGFPFALLVVLGIAFIAIVRVPYARGWIRPAEASAANPSKAAAPFQIDGSGWSADINRRYDAMPEDQRFWVFPAILVFVGAINMLLTIGSGFPFGLLVLVVLLAIIAIRAPYTAGLLKPVGSIGAEKPPALSYAPQVEQASMHAHEAEPPAPARPVSSADAAPTESRPAGELAPDRPRAANDWERFAASEHSSDPRKEHPSDPAKEPEQPSHLGPDV